MNVVQEILSWSSTLPMWQRDALRRVVTTAELSQADEDEVLVLAKAEYGIEPSQAVSAVPLAAEHLPIEMQTPDSVVLLSIHDVANVNALASDQVLEFAPEGLTLVYGENAAGKSGYSRVLKKACRARDAEEILPNVLTGGRGPAQAQFDLRVGDDEVTEVWRDDAAPPDILSRVAIFDSKTSRVFLDEEDEVRFVPYGTDAFARLALVCSRLKERLAAELALRVKESQPPAMEGDTAAARLLAALTAECCPIDAAVLSHLTEPELQEIERLRETRRLDPVLRAETARSLAARLVVLASKMQALADAVSAESISRLRRLSEAAEASSRASRQASGDAFDREPLGGVGSDTWRLMYEAAKKYSEELAYPDVPFPVTEPNSVCVLCQQPLLPPADDRMRRFKAYMIDETARLKRENRELLDTAAEALSKVATYPEDADATLLAELRKRSETIADAVQSECGSMRKTRDACVGATASGEWDSVVAPEVTAIKSLAALAKTLEREAEDAEKSADPVEQTRVAARLGELESRQALSMKIGAVAAAIGGKRKVRDTEKCIASMDTTTITRKGGELQKAAVTEALRARLGVELGALGVTNVPVDVTERGSSGRRLHRLSLSAAVQQVKNLSKVLSEGEHRAVAVAAMLAECGLQGSNFPIVFDDPVSSLDHRYRARVAERLAEEAQCRQVIVLTHDIFFMAELQSHAESKGVTISVQGLRRSAGATGIADGGQPWQTMTVEQRLQWADQERAGLSRMYEEEGESRAYVSGVGNLVDRLRSTWERAIEERVFNRVVTRYQNSVKVERLEKVVFADPDFATIMAARDRLSGMTPAHDEAAGASRPPASPDDLKREIDELRGFVAQLKTRQKAAKASRVS